MQRIERGAVKNHCFWFAYIYYITMKTLLTFLRSIDLTHILLQWSWGPWVSISFDKSRVWKS